jgi:hypothetical protein
MSRVVSTSALELRPAADMETDASALRALAQAAVNVELFTVPLYMGALYSIRGTHQITGANNDFYKNRLWPGPATTATPDTVNEQAFNIVYSVFIEEMLHLQLASDIATAVGVAPDFTSPVIQTSTYGWTCYGPDLTVIPHIVDLRDTVPYDDVKVNIAALSRDQLKLFLAIEEPDDDARMNIKHSALGKYFPRVPFAGWTPDKTETDLPMFGTIGWMYQCYYDYLNLRYDDDTTLWGYVYKPVSQQNDMFNVENSGHPQREYPGFETTVPVSLDPPYDPATAFARAVDMMNAITDQGEGSVLKKSVAFQIVQPRYQASEDALKADYPRYTDTGQPAPSADAVARGDNDGLDHYERFQELATGPVDEVETWPAWFARGGRWTAQDLQTPQYDPNDNPYNLPSTEAIAEAMNRMAAPDQRDAVHTLLSHAAVGSIAGITTVLNRYWASPDVSFPYPSMVGSGDRMAICWALLGQAPDLSVGVGGLDPSKLYHSCQGLDFATPGNDCAAVELFHACRGSNLCKAQGGCGFVQKTTGGHVLCGSTVVTAKDSCGSPGGAGGSAGDGTATVFSAPSDNKCGGYGGCAVPISASQVLSKSGTMQLFDYVGDDNEPRPLQTMDFQVGQLVHDVAYRAYLTVMQHRGQQPPPDPPPPDDLRLVFPPST